MKKLFLTAAIILGFVIGSYAQEYYQDMGGGLFQLGGTNDKMTRNDGTGLFLPGHNNFTTHWNGNEQGYDEPAPLGGGALLLVGFGAAYALSKRKKAE